MADDSMPPRPETEFDFNFPDGIDSEDDIPNVGQNDYGSLDGLPDSSKPSGNHNSNSHYANQQDDDYSTAMKGFSDDEAGDETFDSSWTTNRVENNNFMIKKSPRRLNADDADDEDSPKVKRPRQSLFGGPDRGIEECGLDQPTEDYQSDHDTINTPGKGIRNCMSSINLGEEDGASQSFSLGFGLELSDKGSMSSRTSPAPSEGSIIIPPDDQIPYELRRNIDRKKTTTNLDTDQTGNYDPQQEARQKMLALNKAKAAKKSRKKGKERAPKQCIRKYIVKLRFEAFGNVRNVTNEEDNWPDNWSDVDSEYERNVQGSRCFLRKNTPGLKQQVLIEDPAGKLYDLTGHPAARGCVSCRQNNQTCSMTEDGPYPCRQCHNGGVDCEPILPSAVKGHCKQCRHDSQASCSFEDDPSQALCDYCAENGFDCEARPPEGYKADRVSLDAISYGPGRPHVGCTSCRQQMKKCSLRKKEHKPPCKRCKKDGTGCTFYDPPTQNNVRKGVGTAKTTITDKIAPNVLTPGPQSFTQEDLADLMENDEEIPSREVTPEIEMEDNAGNKGMLTKIKTSFAHPITFSASVHDVSDCNFCEMAIFGLVGHFEREVHVIQWYSGRGYTEVGGGHCDDKGPTNMCVDCTSLRLQIMACSAHELQPLYDDSAAMPEFDTAADDLVMAAESGSKTIQYQLQRWCSMCFSVAVFGCACVQPSVCGEEEVQVPGCGLRLCYQCEVAFRERYGDDLDQMVKYMDSQSKVGELDDQSADLEGKVRADIGFLSQDGLLLRYMMDGNESDN